MVLAVMEKTHNPFQHILGRSCGNVCGLSFWVNRSQVKCGSLRYWPCQRMMGIETGACTVFDVGRSLCSMRPNDLLKYGFSFLKYFCSSRVAVVEGMTRLHCGFPGF